MADIRNLLNGLADEVGRVTAPPDLASRGRRRVRRRRFAAVGTAGLAAAAIGAATLLVPHSTTTTKPSPPADGTAAELLKGHWTIGDRPAPDRVYGAELTWTGDDVIALGGRTDQAAVIRNYAWSPSTRRWRAIADAPDIIGTGHGASVWTGSQLLVMPGYNATKGPDPDRALLYDPQRDTWTETAVLAAKVASYGASAIWTGSRVLVAGAADGRIRLQTYDPAADRWTENSPETPKDHEVSQAVAVQTPDGPLVWSFWSHNIPQGDGSVGTSAGIDVYRLDAGRWTDLTARWPENTWSYYPFMAGDQLELGSYGRWCPACRGPRQPGQPPVVVDLDTLRTTALAPSSLEDQRPPRIWTGRAEVVMESFGKAAVRDPDTGWTDLANAPTYLSSSAPVWTGHELVTETSDGRIVTFGTVAPPALPGCPARWERQSGRYDETARIDVRGTTSAKVCRYSLADKTGSVYDDPDGRTLTPAQAEALMEALAQAQPSNPAAGTCAGGLPPPPMADTLLLLRDGVVTTVTRGGPGCGAGLVSGGHLFGGEPAVGDALEAVFG